MMEIIDMPGKWINGSYIEHYKGLIIEVWETNKAHALGYCKWRVVKWHKEYKLAETMGSSGSRYMLIDEAVIDARYAIERLNAIAEIE